MRFGLILGDVPGTTNPREHLDGLLRQVHAATAAGFTLLSMGQHYVYGDTRWLQPIPTLARLAAEIGPDVQLATTVLIAPLYHPVALAEDLATLDIVTEGRLVVGLGLGYRQAEFAALHVPFGSRVRRFEELIATMRLLWTQSEVTTDGPIWPLDRVTPHLYPRQRPTPPIWIGAHASVGVRRSARLGDAWPISPRMPLDEVRRLLGEYFEYRDQFGRPRGPQPIRREIVLGTSQADAAETFTARTQHRFAIYSAHGRDTVPGMSAGGDEVTAAIVGTPAAVRAQLRNLAQSLPVDPVIVRAQWPGMSVAEIEEYLAELGEEVVRPLADVAVRDAHR